MNIKNKIKIGSLFALIFSGLVITGPASAIGPPIPVTCNVSTESGTDAEFFIPEGRSVKYNILGWGNGTGSTVDTYRGLLESVAEQCILVAASTTNESGDGRGAKNAVKQAKYRYRKLVGLNPKICTSGHSQGGGGAFNAANLLDADCVIALQPDTVFTTSIERPVAPDVDVVCIFSTGDVLAPAEPDNAANCRNNATRYTQEMTAGTHFTPISGAPGPGGAVGGEPGAALRDYARQWLFN